MLTYFTVSAWICERQLHTEKSTVLIDQGRAILKHALSIAVAKGGLENGDTLPRI